MTDEPLLYSLSEHRELIFRCLDAVQPERVVEIGSEAGGMTREMVRWAEANGAQFLTVEPFPNDEIRELAARSESFELVEGRSPDALAATEPADVYLVDGDHNHWTVLHELRAIYERGEPLAILHDVGWPCARRDQYYAPEGLPPDAVHPHSHLKGRLPGHAELVDGGFGGAGEFAVALDEGGPRNGVLTAVEDFLAEREGLVYAEVPAVFGLGLLYSQRAPYAERLAAVLEPWDRNALVARLEENRLALYALVLELQDSARMRDLGSDRVLLRYAERLADLEAENASLRLERGRLRQALDAARAEPGARDRG
jgi:hypothetical protein